MRLTRQEQQHIVDAVQSCIHPDARVWLFGSRRDDDLAGGDIDLYIESPALENGFMSKLKLKVALEDRLGEQKIDVLIRQLPGEPTPIQRMAKEQGQELVTVI